MTLSEFYAHVESEARLNNLTGSISAIAMQNSYSTNSSPLYSCSVFHSGKQLQSGLHANPQAAIEALRLEVKKHFISVNAKPQDIEI